MADTIRDSQSYAPTSLLQPVSWWQSAWPYGVAILAIAAALGVKLVLASVLSGEASYILFVPAVLISSALGGVGPGLLATALGLALGLFFVADPRHLASADAVNGFIFALVGFAVSWRGAILLRFRRIARTSTQDLEAHSAHLQSILDSVPDAMVVINERGLIQSFSSAAERLFGFNAADLVGKNVKILMPSPYREDHDGYVEVICERASAGSSVSAAWWSGNAATVRPFRWSLRSARCTCASNAFSPASSGISLSARRPKRAYRNCNPSLFTCRASRRWAKWPRRSLTSSISRWLRLPIT
jgi:PAS domain-containing protein